MISDNFSVAQVCDLGIGIAEFLENVLGMLALFGTPDITLAGVRDMTMGCPTTRTSPRSDIL